MGLIRLITIALVVWLVWRMIKNYQVAKNKGQDLAPRKASRSRMVKCQHCEVHVPEQDAVQHAEHWFCSLDHRRAYLGKRK